MELKMSFSMSSRLQRYPWEQKPLDLGSAEDTVWSLAPGFQPYLNEIRRVVIFRSRGNGEVKIDVIVNQQGSNLLLINGFSLPDGVTRACFALAKFVSTSALTGYVTVHCFKSMRASKKEALTQTEIDMNSSITEKSTLSPQLVNDFLRLLGNPDFFPDATLVCGTSKFPIHRGILSTRSPVFAAMFKTQMQEGLEGVVNIVDMEPDVLQAMLRYVYSGKTDHLTNSLAGNLLFAADKYQLEELKLICVETLKACMDSNNVFSSLDLGYLFDKSLKEHAVEFTCRWKNFSDLEKTEDWQSLMKERPVLAMDVLTTVVKHVQEKLSLGQELKEVKP